MFDVDTVLECSFDKLREMRLLVRQVFTKQQNTSPKVLVHKMK